MPRSIVMKVIVVVMVVVTMVPGSVVGDDMGRSSSDCGGTYLTETGNITSPRYPKKYPHNQLCVYNIKGSADSRLKFWCSQMNLQGSPACDNDWLKVNGLYLCGKTKIKEVYGVGEIRVEFRSDGSSNRKRGFKCHFQRVTGGPFLVSPTQTSTQATTTPSRQSSTGTRSVSDTRVTNPLCIPFLNTTYNYDEVLHKSLLFYEAQRSGYLPASQRVTWRRDSATQDALDANTLQQVDLEGGYYDAGDYMKFGYPMAGAATILAWGAIEYTASYIGAGEMPYMLAAVKWATDYFIKAHVAPNVFYGQVGKGSLDHSYWGQPEDMTMSRPAYKITESKPGSDLAGETAAAFAAASILFRQTDSLYSDKCLLHARQLYSFANTYKGKYSESITDAAEFYKSYGIIEDELAWAAAWLYRATGESQYLDQAKQHYLTINRAGVSEFSWAERTPGVMVLLAQIGDASIKSSSRNDLEAFCNKIIRNTKRTPKDLVFISQWGSLRHAANVAFVCLRAADLGINAEEYRQFGQQQIDYMLGDGGRSYVVGFGHNPPQRPHHASSSCKDPPASCTWNDFSSSQPNPQVLYGALVGGPDENDYYEDVRSDYIKNEVTCDYNAGFQSAVAALRQLSLCNKPFITTKVPSTVSTQSLSSTKVTTTDLPLTTTPGVTTPGVTTPGNNCASVSQTNEWTNNFQADLIIPISTTTTSWTITLNFSQVVANFQVWIADASPTSGTSITLTNKTYNGSQAPGNTLTIKFWVTYSGTKPDISSLTFNNINMCLA